MRVYGAYCIHIRMIKRDEINMTTQKIVCVKTEHPHKHIISVGVGGTSSAPTETMTVKAVRDKIDAGDTFETHSASTGKDAKVLKDTCKEPNCTVETIRSHSDAIADNNLDNLPTCP